MTTLRGRSYLLSPLGDYEAVGQHVMNALVPEVEGIDDCLEILDPEVNGGRVRQVVNSIHDEENPDRDMNVDTCWGQWYAEFPDASLTRTFGNSARGCRNHVEHHHACLCAWPGAPWRLQICTR